MWDEKDNADQLIKSQKENINNLSLYEEKRYRQKLKDADKWIQETKG